jgi:hypothetical protein
MNKLSFYEIASACHQQLTQYNFLFAVRSKRERQEFVAIAGVPIKKHAAVGTEFVEVCLPLTA